ncbi:MAG: VTT domain-containing protein [Coriobacteriales bacterium]|jgi:uncharacterized membrane protein YdjX (TVP38/TMEM64 family)|nr:VTT domain-containing protein [Coriobacteriales bacterium]
MSETKANKAEQPQSTAARKPPVGPAAADPAAADPPAEKPPAVDPAAADPAAADAPAEDPAAAGPATVKPPVVDPAAHIKFIGLLVFFVLIIVIGVFVFNFIRSVGTENLAEDLEQAVRDAGPAGILMCLALQFVQVVVAFIPGEVVQIAIGYIYGTIGGGLLTIAGALISSIFIFYLVRKLGAPFVQGMIGGKDNKLMRFLDNEKRLNATVFILYLIPGLPKDVFNYLVPLTRMRPAAFFVLSTIARAPAIFASTFVADAFKQGNYLSMVIVAVIFGGLAVVGIVFNEKVMAAVDKALAALPTPSKRP